MNNLTETRDTICRLSTDFFPWRTFFVVTSTDESSAAYCRHRRHCSDTSSHSLLRTVPSSAHWWFHKKLPAVMETESSSPLPQQRTTCSYRRPE